MKKSLLALLLAVLMVVSLLPATALADGEDGTVNNPFTTVADYIAAIADHSWDGKGIYLKIDGQEFNGSGFNLTNVQSWETPPELHLTITNCEFTGNTAQDNANPSFMYLSNCKELYIEDCTFDAGSTGLTYGINWNLIQVTDATVVIKDSTFTGVYRENAIKLNQRNGADDAAADVKGAGWSKAPIAASIKSASIENVAINSDVAVILLGSAAKGANGAAAPSTGAFPVTIKNVSSTGTLGKVVVFEAYLADEDAETAAKQALASGNLSAVSDYVKVMDANDTISKTANGDLAKDEDFVAEVTGGDKYTSLQSAIDAATAGATVKLLKNIEVSTAITVPAGVTIDGGNHSITSAEGYSGYIINLNNADSKNITLENLVLDGNDYNGPILKVPQASDISGFKANAVVFRNAKQGVYISNENKNNVSANNIKFVNCNFEDMTYAGIYAQRGNIAVSDGCYFYNIIAPEGGTAAGILMDTFYFGDKAYTLSVTDSVFTNIVGTTSSEKATGAVSFTGSGTVSEFTMTDNSFYGNTIDLRIGKDTAPTFTETVISNNGNIKVVTASDAKIYTAAFYSDNSLYETIVTEGTMTMPAIRKSGYAFLGWVSGGKTYLAGETVTITANTTFTASWVRHADTPYVPEPEQPVEPETPVFPFYDVPTSAWYYTAVKYVYENKLMDGVDTYVFAPNDTLTRAMVWTIIARMSGVDTTGGNTWYAKAQEWVITNGISDGENPTAAITRQELVTMLYRYAQIKGYDVSVGENTNILSYIDATSISEYAMSAFQWACGSGLTEGDENGALTPLATATRAQAAAMIMRFCQGVK